MYSRGFKLKISLIVTFDWIVTQRWVRGQSGGSWGWQTQLDHSQVCSTCISRVYTCISRAYTCIHVKYTCYTSGNGLVMLAIPKNPNFDPSHNSVASEIFLSLILKNDPCLKNGTLKLFLGNFWPWKENNLIVYVQIWIVITSGPLKSQSLMHRSWFG